MEEDNKKNEIKQIPVPQPPERIKSNTVVKTYAEDMAEVIENDPGGLVKNIIHTEEEHEAEKRNLSPKSKKNEIFMFLGIFLLAVSLIISSFLFFRKTSNTVPVTKQFTPIIFNDQITPLEILGLGKDEITQDILKEIQNTKVGVGGVEGIYPTLNKQMIGLRKFISLTNFHFTPNQDTTFVSDNFLMGVVKNQVNIDATSGTGFFILLKMRSITDVFDSLRAWEPNLLTDLHNFLGMDISSSNNYLFTKNFQDGIIENKNARILYDQGGNIVLMYIFADDNSVIITDSEAAAHEIILRLASNQAHN